MLALLLIFSEANASLLLFVPIALISEPLVFWIRCNFFQYCPAACSKWEALPFSWCCGLASACSDQDLPGSRFCCIRADGTSWVARAAADVGMEISYREFF